MTIQELHTQCRACTKCRLREKATQVVPGEGPERAEIMFIGEGPGVVEDKQGRPFVGPAGKFLDELLTSIALRRTDVFIANMVKCRPPGNRDPQEDEMELCAPWLDKQIDLIKPSVYVPLGRHALHKFLPNAIISKEHGKLYKRRGEVYFVMYHPAVALYNGSYRQVLMEDFLVLKGFLDGNVKPEMLDDIVTEIMAEKQALVKEKQKESEQEDQVGMSLVL